MSDSDKAPRFDDWRNITIGRARVIWAPAIMWREIEGWVLPGGRRTIDKIEAYRAAEWLNELMGA